MDVSGECREANEYIILVTSLPDSISAESVLSVYRYRWQIELYFKRLKSLMAFGEVPKKKPKNIETWLNGKMLAALLIEIQLSKLDFSPTG
jgi:transposase